jgi:class 3 adenylate cyclase
MPGSLVIADANRHQLGQLSDLRDLAPQPLAGFTEQQRAWRVLGESGAVSRFGRDPARRPRRGAGPFGLPLGTGQDE